MAGRRFAEGYHVFFSRRSSIGETSDLDTPVGEASRSRCNRAARLPGQRRQKALFIVGRWENLSLAIVRARAIQRARGTGPRTTKKRLSFLFRSYGPKTPPLAAGQRGDRPPHYGIEPPNRRARACPSPKEYSLRGRESCKSYHLVNPDSDS